MFIVCEQTTKTLTQLLKEQLGLNENNLPLIPVEFAELNLDNICIRNIDSRRQIIITAEVREKNFDFILFAERSAPTEYRYAFSLKVEKQYSLERINVLGQEIRELGFISLEIEEILYASTLVEIAKVNEWNRIITAEPEHEKYAFSEDQDLNHGIRLLGILHIAHSDNRVALFLGFGDNKQVLNTMPVVPKEPDYRREVWHAAQYTFGPITLRRVGLTYSDGKLHFLLDALLAFAGVELALNGLGVYTPIHEWDPHDELRSLDLSYDIDVISMAGSLLKDTLDDQSFAGAAVVETAGRTLTAIGAYSESNGEPSLFVYAKTNQPLGGPPYLYVTGLGLGFGINRRFIEPAIEEVGKVPLLLDEKPGDILKKLEGSDGKSWIVEEPGTSWLAVGLNFTSFRLIDSKVLLIGQFGKEFEMLLLGLSEIKFPKNNSTPYVNIGVQLKGVWKPAEGFVGASALLTNNSYLFHPDCKLTGEFSSWFWYDDSPLHKHKGDFVVTAGGYHPHFTIPDHYPKVQSLGLNWPIAGGTIKGNSYFSFTPSYAMGGGNLELSYGNKGAKLSLTAHAHVLIQWEPFQFDASFGVTISASLRVSVKYVGSKTFHVELGADLDMWGTPTGGKVSIGFKSLRLTVGFGADRSEHKPPSVDGLLNMLPRKENFVQAQIENGLLKEESHGSSIHHNMEDDLKWIVRPDELKFQIESGVPFTELRFLDISKPSNNPSLSIRPLNVGQVQASILHVSIRYNGDLSDSNRWDYELNDMQVPEALWGTPINREDMRPALKTIWGTVNLSIWPKKREDESVGTISLPDGLGTEHLDTRNIFKVRDRQTPGKPIWERNSAKVIGEIHDKLLDEDVGRRRDELIKQLKKANIYVGNNDPLTDLADQASAVYTEPPLLLKL
ncbi:DUF6603 domain-containing protein [Priestia megaterium]|uniref:DUF6603 domain-containing protein n=1 Tax=Priestia megaterium TaxID=1404 RepID=UPI0033949D71